MRHSQGKLELSISQSIVWQYYTKIHLASLFTLFEKFSAFMVNLLNICESSPSQVKNLHIFFVFNSNAWDWEDMAQINLLNNNTS